MAVIKFGLHKIIDFFSSLFKTRSRFGENFLESEGHCSSCDQETSFVSKDSWLRDNYVCTKCGSIPRERALMQVIQQFYPDWKSLIIHETSPGSRGASLRLKSKCNNYVPSYFFKDQELGSLHHGVRCENIEKLTFDDESIDLHVSQDVMEHVFDPYSAFNEIARTLKPGGAHIFTVPLVNKENPSKLRARLGMNNLVEHIKQPMYHGNPIDSEGSLVTMDWGYDIVEHIFDATGLFTFIIYIDDIGKGIRAEYIEVLMTVKPKTKDT